MKYTRLTKEQFEELHQEFINFLASQSISADEWEEIKANRPKVAEDELDVFSDVVWEGVLNQAQYVEHFSPKQMFLFKISQSFMNLIAVKIEKDGIDITTKKGYSWLQENLLDDSVNMYTSTKPVSDDRNKDIFALIQQGASITRGNLYDYFEKVLQA